MRATYTFTARSFARVIAQYVSTRRDPTLYADPVAAKDGSFTGSVLLAYKLNWQTVLYAGYGDNRELTDTSRPRAVRATALRQALVRLPALTARPDSATGYRRTNSRGTRVKARLTATARTA